MAHHNTEYVQHLKLKLRTVKAENLSEGVGQRSSSVAVIAGIYTGPGMVPWVAVSPPNVKGSAKRRKWVKKHLS